MKVNGNSKGTSERTQETKRTAAVRAALETRSPVSRSRTPLYAGIAVGVVVAGVLVAGLYQAMTKGEAKRSEPRATTTVATRAEPASVTGETPSGSANEIVVGMVGPFTGPNKELGRSMKSGIELAFKDINESGGIEGRKLILLALDDGYDPVRTTQVLKELVEERKVAAMVGSVGSASSAVAAPYLIEKKVPFIGAFSGSPALRRDPPDRYIFNFRPSTAEEAAAAVRYLLETRRLKPKEIAVLTQQDEFGDAGFAGVMKQLRSSGFGQEPPLRVTYRRNSADVAQAVSQVRSASPKAVVLIATYQAAAAFVQKTREAGLRLIYAATSEVAPAAFAEELLQLGGQSLTENVMVTQVVPSPSSSASVVVKYRRAMDKYTVGEKPGFVSLEGYVVGSLVIEGIRRAGKRLDAEKLVDAFDGFKSLDLGLGIPISFSPQERQASHKIWGSLLEPSGTYRMIELE